MKAFEKNPTVLLDPMEEQGSEVFNQEQIQQALNTARRIQKKTCSRGHDTDRMRTDGECPICHRNRNQKYDLSASGRYSKLKRHLRYEIRQKKLKIKELEGLLNEQKN